MGDDDGEAGRQSDGEGGRRPDTEADQRQEGDEADKGGAISVDPLLEETGFSAESSVLTRRQAEVLALRENGHKQETIANVLGTSRANIASVEASARENVSKARETVAFAEALNAPVSVEIHEDTDLYDIPDQVFKRCDDADMKVEHTAPELMKLINDAAMEAIKGRKVRQSLVVTVADDGTVRVRTV